MRFVWADGAGAGVMKWRVAGGMEGLLGMGMGVERRGSCLDSQNWRMASPVEGRTLEYGLVRGAMVRAQARPRETARVRVKGREGREEKRMVRMYLRARSTVVHVSLLGKK